MKYSRRIKKISYLLLVIVLFLTSFALGIYQLSIYQQMHEPETDEQRTTVETLHSIRGLKMRTMMNPLLRTSFKQYQDRLENGTYKIPGLNAASSMRAGNSEVCTNMVPQSVCVVEEYLLIGAYCHTGLHYSVIYVLDKKTHGYIKTIVLPGRHHLGGIAYDAKHKMIWVAGYKERAQANAFSVKRLQQYNYDLYPRPIAFDFETDLYTIPRASLMTYYNGYLYVGYFQMDDDSILQKFKIAEDGSLAMVGSARYQAAYDGKLPFYIAAPVNVSIISSRVQSVAFSEHRMFVTESYGIGRSKIAVFHLKSDIQKDQRYTNDMAINIIKMPQKLEQIAVDGEDMYSIYESASRSYRFYSYPNIDRVIPMKVKTVSNFHKK